MDYLYPINAIHADGTVVLLQNKEEVLKFLPWKSVGNNRKIWTREYNYTTKSYEYFYVTIDWILRDDCGRRVNPEDFKPEYPPYRSYMNEAAIHAMERGLPIPYTGRYKCRKHDAPSKKNSGILHYFRNVSKHRYDEKEYDLKHDTRFKRKNPWY